ncbi:dockerin type I repeat-containing protein [Ruminococcus flavefaciens]|uniref:dockerin type I repeat-containing protein n=1 Tax=Ruminococcus flavefaciens TaxID=1265 RepID=UPI0026EDDCD3|nr:dockerin type I repeat-containing protein [Ruminococcus flavefaciens]
MKIEITNNKGYLDSSPAQLVNVLKIRILSEDAGLIKGDANCDEQVDMADVVLIMQALANPNIYGGVAPYYYGITELGKLNGDMNGDGLTVADALSIQKMLLGLEDENSEANSGIVVFEMTPSKIDVDEFLANNPTIKNSYKDDDLYNITPRKITEKFGFQIFKDQNECETFLVYNGETHQLGKGFGGPGTISFAVADLNGDEHYELYFTYSWGSGLDHPGIDCFDTSSSIKFEGFNQYLSKHCVFAVENGKLGVYKARYTSADFVSIKAGPTEKIGEIIADKETNKVVFRTFKQQ